MLLYLKLYYIIQKLKKININTYVFLNYFFLSYYKNNNLSYINKIN